MKESPELIDKYMRTALLFSEMSKSTRAKVGAILVKNGSILAHAWNGTPSGYYTNICELDDGSTDPFVLHAEQNLLIKMAKSTETTVGAIVFCTHTPCVTCAKLLGQAKIEKFYYYQDYRNPEGIGFLRNLGVIVQRVDLD